MSTHRPETPIAAAVNQKPASRLSVASAIRPIGKAHEEGITWYDEAQDWRSGQRLDYGFVSPGLAVELMAAHIDDQAPGSDHQPNFFELTL